MDCMAAIFDKAADAGVLGALGPPLTHRLSLYADDAALFIQPSISEVHAVKALLLIFGHATGLRANFSKTSISPINCKGIDLQMILQDFQCPVKPFPIKYLGMPLSDSRLKRADHQPILDAFHKRFKGWQHNMVSIDGRLAHIKQILSAMPVFQMISINMPVWLAKAIDKLRRGYLWEMKEVASGGKCLVSWKAVCLSKCYGGLGISNLAAQSVALRTRWLWQSWTSPDKPWHGLPMPIDGKVRALFNASVIFSLGNGEKISFWHDPWIQGATLQFAFPVLYSICTRRKLTVKEALQDGAWFRHLRTQLSPAAIREFMTLWRTLQDIHLQDRPDSIAWRWTTDGAYTAHSAYMIQFEGSTRFQLDDILWKSDATMKCKIFSWLAILGKCLIADNLARRGWPHNSSCALCLASPETPVHLLTTCPYAIELWILVLRSCRLPQSLAPSPTTTSLLDWGLQGRATLPRLHRKAWASLLSLVWWHT